jgi:hypothetical protein
MQSTELIVGVDSLEELCKHFWVIESPNGPTSNGECRNCGEVREFKNSIQITSWESDGNHAQRSAKMRASSSL